MRDYPERIMSNGNGQAGFRQNKKFLLLENSSAFKEIDKCISTVIRIPGKWYLRMNKIMRQAGRQF